MFFTRLASGIVLVLLTIGSIYFGGAFLWVLTLLISAMGMFELYRLAGIEKKKLGIMGYVSCIVYFVSVYFGKTEFMLMAIVLGFMLMAITYVVAFPKYKAEHATITVFGLVYIAVMLGFTYLLREQFTSGALLLPLVFICAWGNDTFAYLTGVTMGKHKMFPKLSPKKSVEGFVGGIIGAALLSALYGFIVASHISDIDNVVIIFTVVGGVGAALSVVGDLIASAFKRHYGIKDYGNIIPGHGGILDRYDSVIFTAPAVYCLVVLLNTIM